MWAKMSSCVAMDETQLKQKSLSNQATFCWTMQKICMTDWAWCEICKTNDQVDSNWNDWILHT